MPGSYGIEQKEEVRISGTRENLIKYILHKTAETTRQTRWRKNMIREAIAKLTRKEDLTYEEARGVMEEMMDGTATQAQMGGLLMALSMQGETIDEITAFAEVMREKGVKIKPEREVIDIVGTGGD